MNFQPQKPHLVGGALALLLIGALSAMEIPESPLLQRLVLPDQERKPLPRGTVAPDFQLTGLHGEEVRLADLKGVSSVLIFVSLSCPHCQDLMERLLDRGLPDLDHRLVLIRGGSRKRQELPAEIRELEARIADLVPVLQDTSGEISKAYRIRGVPTAYMIDARGKIEASKGGVSGGLELVEELVEAFLKPGGA